MVAASASRSSLAHIVITGNEIAGYNATTPNAISVSTSDGGAVFDLLIATNSATLATASHPNVGIYVGAGVSNFVIEHNTVDSTDTAIHLSATALGLIGDNLATNIGTAKYGGGDDAAVIHDLQGVAAGALPMAANGSKIYCIDCTITYSCTGGGTGAIAKYLNGVKVCN